MCKEELQYLSDTAIIELLASDFEITKQAGLFDQLGFNSVASAIKQFVSEHVREDVPGGYAGSVLNLLTPGIMWKIHPLLGVVGAVAYEMGFNLTSIFSKIKNGLSQSMSEGQGLSLGDVDSLVKGSVGLSATGASLDPARNLLKQARNPRYSRWSGYSNTRPNIPFGHQKGSSLLVRVFGNLGKLRGRVLAAGIIVWFLKTLLLATGLIVGAGALTSVFQSDEGQPQETKQLSPGASYNQEPSSPSKPVKYQVEERNSFKPSGRGSKHFPNNSQNLWIVPLINRSINNTLLAWAVDVYPSLAQYENDVLDSSSFRQAVQSLKKNYNFKRPDALIMPLEYHSRKQVVDTFVEDVARSITN